MKLLKLVVIMSELFLGVIISGLLEVAIVMIVTTLILMHFK